MFTVEALRFHWSFTEATISAWDEDGDLRIQVQKGDTGTGGALKWIAGPIHSTATLNFGAIHLLAIRCHRFTLATWFAVWFHSGWFRGIACPSKQIAFHLGSWAPISHWVFFFHEAQIYHGSICFLISKLHFKETQVFSYDVFQDDIVTSQALALNQPKKSHKINSWMTYEWHTVRAPTPTSPEWRGRGFSWWCHHCDTSSTGERPGTTTTCPRTASTEVRHNLKQQKMWKLIAQPWKKPRDV